MTTADVVTPHPHTAGMWTPPCDGPCDKKHRPYARSGIPSVTTLIDKIPKDQLQWGASKEAALFAVHHQSEWRGLDPADAVDRIRTHFRGVWDRSADVGTLVHSVNDSWIRNEEWSADDVDLSTLHIKNRDGLEELIARMPGYVEGLAAFWNDCQPQTLAAEVVLRNSEFGWVGTADWIATLPALSGDDVWVLDAKTTSQLDPGKGVYLDSWRPQLFMYQQSTEVVHHHGTQEVASWPLEDCFPRPTRAGILHMRGDGGYQLIEVDTQAEILPRLVEALKVVREWGLKGGAASPAPVIVSEHHAPEPEVAVYEPRVDAPASDGMLG